MKIERKTVGPVQILFHPPDLLNQGIYADETASRVIGGTSRMIEEGYYPAIIQQAAKHLGVHLDREAARVFRQWSIEDGNLANDRSSRPITLEAQTLQTYEPTLATYETEREPWRRGSKLPWIEIEPAVTTPKKILGISPQNMFDAIFKRDIPDYRDLVGETAREMRVAFLHARKGITVPDERTIDLRPQQRGFFGDIRRQDLIMLRRPSNLLGYAQP